MRWVILCLAVAAASAFTSTPLASLDRRSAGRAIAVAGASFSLPDWLGGVGTQRAAASASAGNTNEVIKTVAGIRHRRLGGGDIVVSELGMGTQRWGGADFNSPDEALCHKMLDMGTANGLNLVDTAEQYPIPSDRTRPEGLTEEIIGNWLVQDKSRREKLVIATKITGGANVTPKNIIRDCEGSLRRLQTDYIDVYNLHWPARYTPQSNWGQSLEYNPAAEKAPYYRDHASFDEIVAAMGKLIEQGKIRGYGSCNDNAVGLMGMAAAAKRLGVPGPCTMQGDYSILNRRSEENGLSEASSPELENCGWMVLHACPICTTFLFQLQILL
jgi:aryl-alcohol dehydrogenase-like predicted oxidoreductase